MKKIISVVLFGIMLVSNCNLSVFADPPKDKHICNQPADHSESSSSSSSSDSEEGKKSKVKIKPYISYKDFFKVKINDKPAFGPNPKSGREQSVYYSSVGEVELDIPEQHEEFFGENGYVSVRIKKDNEGFWDKWWKKDEIETNSFELVGHEKKWWTRKKPIKINFGISLTSKDEEKAIEGKVPKVGDCNFDASTEAMKDQERRKKQELKLKQKAREIMGDDADIQVEGDTRERGRTTIFGGPRGQQDRVISSKNYNEDDVRMIKAEYAETKTKAMKRFANEEPITSGEVFRLDLKKKKQQFRLIVNNADGSEGADTLARLIAYGGEFKQSGIKFEYVYVRELPNRLRKSNNIVDFGLARGVINLNNCCDCNEHELAWKMVHFVAMGVGTVSWYCVKQLAKLVWFGAKNVGEVTYKAGQEIYNYRRTKSLQAQFAEIEGLNQEIKIVERNTPEAQKEETQSGEDDLRGKDKKAVAPTFEEIKTEPSSAIKWKGNMPVLPTIPENENITEEHTESLAPDFYEVIANTESEQKELAEPII